MENKEEWKGGQPGMYRKGNPEEEIWCIFDDNYGITFLISS